MRIWQRDARSASDPAWAIPSSAARAGVSDRLQPATLRPNARARRGHLAPDGAEAGDAERLALQPLGLAVLLPLPLAGPERRDRVRDPPIERDDEPEDELGYRRGVATRAVGHVDAPPARGADVDGVELRARRAR